MTFADWAKKREWWKSNTKFEFERMWNRLIGAGHTPAEVGEMLDDLGNAVANEFGSSW